MPGPVEEEGPRDLTSSLEGHSGGKGSGLWAGMGTCGGGGGSRLSGFPHRVDMGEGEGSGDSTVVGLSEWKGVICPPGETRAVGRSIRQSKRRVSHAHVPSAGQGWGQRRGQGRGRLFLGISP